MCSRLRWDFRQTSARLPEFLHAFYFLTRTGIACLFPTVNPTFFIQVGHSSFKSTFNLVLFVPTTLIVIISPF